MRKEQLEGVRFFMGPMTKNVVDGVINYTVSTGDSVGLIASRRQVDYKGGYVNNWDTKSFVTYVKARSRSMLVCRDHGGPLQGLTKDTGVISLKRDVLSFLDIIHIDPWKYKDFGYGIDYTVGLIKFLHNTNPHCMFEIGTEQSIYEMNPECLYEFISAVSSALGQFFFEDRIAYVVIQSGTSLKSGTNTGIYDEPKLIAMTQICDYFKVKSKEHNGDFLDPNQVKRKFSLGLSAINIAPELACIENNAVLRLMSYSDRMKDMWFKLCIEDGQWAKWFPAGYNYQDNRDTILRVCGHYVFSNRKFTSNFDLNTVAAEVQDKIFNFLEKRSIKNG